MLSAPRLYGPTPRTLTLGVTASRIDVEGTGSHATLALADAYLVKDACRVAGSETPIHISERQHLTKGTDRLYNVHIKNM